MGNSWSYITDTIDFITIATTGNQRTLAIYHSKDHGRSIKFSVRVFSGEMDHKLNTITMSSPTGNAQDFGDLTQARKILLGSNSIRGVAPLAFQPNSTIQLFCDHCNTGMG